MSISSEITRLNNAKASIKSSIENKGIAVSDTKKLDEYSSLIDSIEVKKPEQSKSVTPTETVQNVTPDSGYVLNNVSVGAISNTYVGSGVTRKSAQTYTPGTSDQTIASGQYLSGNLTIKGDPNLVSGNIKSGTSIFGVTGSYSGSTPNLQSKSVTYTSNGAATVTPDNGYDGLSSVDVTVNVSGGGGGTHIEYTTYKSNTKSIVITHNLGVIPKCVAGFFYTATGSGATWRLVSFCLACGSPSSGYSYTGSSGSMICRNDKALASYSEFPSTSYLGTDYYVMAGNATTSTIEIQIGSTSKLKIASGQSGTIVVSG